MIVTWASSFRTWIQPACWYCRFGLGTLCCKHVCCGTLFLRAFDSDLDVFMQSWKVADLVPKFSGLAHWTHSPLQTCNNLYTLFSVNGTKKSVCRWSTLSSCINSSRLSMFFSFKNHYFNNIWFIWTNLCLLDFQRMIVNPSFYSLLFAWVFGLHSIVFVVFVTWLAFVCMILCFSFHSMNPFCML